MAALDQYHKSALTRASLDYRNRVELANARNPQTEYEAAKARVEQHLAALRGWGRSSEAAALEGRLRTASAAPNLSMKLDEATQAGAAAAAQRRFDVSRIKYKEAVQLAEQTQPHDSRLITALDQLGNQYMGEDFAAADAAYSRELKAVQELYAPLSPMISMPLQSLDTSPLMRHDYPAAHKLDTQAG